jgi:hypothetical protein
MEHPRVISWLHRVFNPVRQFELRELEKSHRLQHVKADEYERRKAAILNPGDVSFTKFYVMLGLTVAAVVVVLLFVLLR